jgi:AcrR family transcriptional regulator
MIYVVNMIHATASQRRRSARLDAIVDAAMSIVLERGLSALTIADVAKAVDYTPGALYRYFPSKGALVAELNKRAVVAYTEVAAHLTAQCAHTAHTELLTLLGVGFAFPAAARHRPALFALVANTLGDPRRFVGVEEAAHIPSLLALLETIGGTVASAQEAGALQAGPPTDRATRLVFGLMGVLQLRKLERDASAELLDVDGLARGLTLDILVGWGADRALLTTLSPAASALAQDALQVLP